MINGKKLYTPGEVAGAFKVDIKTVSRWRKGGKLDGAIVPTPGGHYRYDADAIDKMLAIRL